MKQTVLILGGLGFIGQNLIIELLSTSKYEIIVFDYRNLPINFDHKQVKVYQGNFNNSEDIEKLLIKYNFDIIYHLISTTIPANSNINIPFDIQSNLGASVQLLNLMEKYQVPKIVFFSSGGTVYGLINEEENIHENHATNPISSHGIIKLSIEKYIQLYQHLYGIKFLILRLGNPYGELHLSQKQGFINVVIKQALQQKKVIVRGNGQSIRDYIYIKDLVKIIKELSAHDSHYNQIFNIGSGQGYSINEILSKIKKLIPTLEVYYDEAPKYDVPKVVLNINQLINTVKNIYFTPLDMGIKYTYDWYKQYLLEPYHKG